MSILDNITNAPLSYTIIFAKYLFIFPTHEKNILQCSIGDFATWQLSDKIELQEYYLIHYNWGQHGKYNGYFHHTDTEPPNHTNNKLR